VGNSTNLGAGRVGKTILGNVSPNLHRCVENYIIVASYRASAVGLIVAARTCGSNVGLEP
jgi:hypothetical protein